MSTTPTPSPSPAPASTSGSIIPEFLYSADGLAVTVTNATQNPQNVNLSYSWSFGDGTAAATGSIVTHTYAAAGTYDIVLTVAAGESNYVYTTLPLSITVPLTQASTQWPTNVNDYPHADFQIDNNPALAMSFTDLSTTNYPPITWSWDFGDGTTSTLQNPSHTYSAPGLYNVTLTVTNSVSGTDYSNSVTMNLDIPSPPAVTADFAFTTAGLTATFTDSSTTTASGATINHWTWDFGDGNTSSTQNPVHTYSAPGTYTVTLTAGDSSANTGNVSEPVQVATASFSYVLNGLEVSYTDTSTTLHPPISAWLWAFGDGQTSNTQDPSHAYAQAGTYTVSLTITDASGANSPVTQVVTVAASTPTPTPTPSPTPTPTPTPTPAPTPTAPTYVLKGFVSISALEATAPNAPVSTLGELSTYSRTYAKEIMVFGGSTGGNTPSSIDLNVFSSVNVNNQELAVPSDYATSILGIATWIYNQAVAGSFTSDITVFLNAINLQYSGVINNVTVDEMLTQGGIWMPGQVQFFFTSPSTIDPTDTALSRIKIWFSDQSFQSEYDLYTIDIVPPITPLDNFFTPAPSVQTAVDDVTIPMLMANIALARNDEPETVLNSAIYNWMDPNTAGNYIPTVWTYLIWGDAGNNIDAIKEALQAYILANSAHTQSEWALIFPDIFTSTEFILTPLWTQYAIPNQTLVTGMYQPTTNPNQALTMALNTTVGGAYTPQYITDHLNIVPSTYKTLTIAAVGNPQNQGGITDFQVRWPDYLDVSTSSTDFDRMAQSTQGFVQLLYQLLSAAETMTDISDLPVGVTRLVRTNPTTGDAVMYAVANYDEVDYLVVTKAYLVAKYGASTNTEASIGISYSGTYNNGAFQLLSSTTAMQLQFQANNAVAGPLTWTLVDTTASSAIIDSSSGLLQVTFPSAGLYTVTLTLSDSAAHTTTQTFTFNYQVPQTGGSQSLQFGQQTLPEATVGVSYAGTIDVTGGAVPYSITNQSLPPGLSAVLNGTVINISGTPTQASSSSSGTTAVLGIVDSTPNTPQAASLQFTISIAAQGTVSVAMSPPTNTNVTIGAAYSGSLGITGGVSPYTLVSATLPAGLSAAISTNTVAISGTPTTQTTGTFAATVVIADTNNNQGTLNFNMNVAT